jgi:hypothetical protein
VKVIKVRTMSSDVTRQILEILEERANARPSAMEFELAYQARTAIDRIRFAIKQTEQFRPQSGQTREVCIQLLEALQRLEGVERRFQTRSVRAGVSVYAETPPSDKVVNGIEKEVFS